MSEAVAETEMPRYKCHKVVHALKIASLLVPERGDHDEDDGERVMYTTEVGFAPIRLSGDFMRRHKPEAGGYYVVYEDGYKSFSPAKAFEDGYTRI